MTASRFVRRITTIPFIAARSISGFTSNGGSIGYPRAIFGVHSLRGFTSNDAPILRHSAIQRPRYHNQRHTFHLSMSTSTSSKNEVKELYRTTVTSSGGSLLRLRHPSISTNTDMTFSLFLPSSHFRNLRSKNQQTPALYWLSGLTCDDTNFSTKAGAFEAAEREGIALVMPDTSPRGADVADAEGWDMGQGAGFYVDATEGPWKEHYRMESYVTKELPRLLEETYGVGGEVGGKSVFG
eukprot:CAMPEP_0172504396 /NCGR_PEP_ID=MMETSP1066-20121228/178372_1 /TAXON_ID=671091 /ORGANISM="Coscinodiscus wailesii, Strain CCMP2513" /LENGTH=238 /DNA_ID=CAMNT_0013280571 /DNA_START=12 /DNA_END=725 /DNA_ORIENTATION=-